MRMARFWDGAGAAHRIARALEVRQHHLGMLEEHLAGVGQRHAAAGAVEQLRTNLRLQRRDLLAQGRLRNVQPP